jgi:antirestriction protein ArdC
MQVDIYQSVTASIIADLEKGAAPWAKPWKEGNNGGIMPINYASRRQYNGKGRADVTGPATWQSQP